MYAANGGGVTTKTGMRNGGTGKGGKGASSGGFSAEVGLGESGRSVRRWVMSLAIEWARARTDGLYVGARMGSEACSESPSSSALTPTSAMIRQKLEVISPVDPPKHCQPSDILFQRQLTLDQRHSPIRIFRPHMCPRGSYSQQL